MSNNYRARIRMYRHGLGDCLLIGIPGEQREFFMLIDCGVILGTQNAGALMTRVMDDIRNETKGHLDLLVATHEHWDHLSGFVQAANSFAGLTVDEVWMAWTEDPADPLGCKLSQQRKENVEALRLGATHLEMAGDSVGANNVSGLLSFFGAARGPSTRDALEAVRKKSNKIRYCRPTDAPINLGDTGTRAYVLGPPPDEKALRKTSPSASKPQTYQLTAEAFAAHARGALTAQDVRSPFGTIFAVPWIVAKDTAHFNANYFSKEPWRRIDSAWLDGATSFALALDNATNNTSLVLALELPSVDGKPRDVLLFAADAQVGNWLSWQDLKWTVDGQLVTGPDLLKRTVVYKVGHHGSHNATLRQQGLELMSNLECALLPVDQEMAQKKNWGRMPLPSLIEALETRAPGRVLRSDRPVDGSKPSDGRLSIREDGGDRPLWIEVSI